MCIPVWLCLSFKENGLLFDGWSVLSVSRTELKAWITAYIIQRTPTGENDEQFQRFQLKLSPPSRTVWASSILI